ncbi:hypothetical protein KFK09_029278 [Dendrobium nobile]|uniref:Uncharacterized protein n=1 Tax=Dendrobium nobile TaxID=94219 RepID=A0A8T3A3Z2_DENNO|nr:hypothetical protein KFK09_029278 [Dendrobium nobile]
MDLSKAAITPCPTNAFVYNSTLCACNPGLFLATDGCKSLTAGGGGGGEWKTSSGVDEQPTFLSTVLPLESIRRLTRSQEALLGATSVALIVWLAFCFSVRFGRLGDGETFWFRIRWWISRLDVNFYTRHWLEDNKVVVKRKTELGGTFSVASWILFAGLFSALLYQIIAKRTFEVHKVRPTNAPDLLQFDNDMEFNITTVSSMTCSHLRSLKKIVTTSPGSIYYKVSLLTLYSNYTCYNTSRGPAVSIKCNRCQISREDLYISWQFVDLPKSPASAVGFQFNLTARDHIDDTHVSYVSGTLAPGSYRDGELETLRGPDMNLLKINLFPTKFNYKHRLKLIQPLLHDYLPGSSFSDIGRLQASLQNSRDGLLNITLLVRYLSDYIVEVDKELTFGIVSFLAEVGGLSVSSLAVFLYLLSQCEARFKNLRFEDTTMRHIRRHKRAQRHWDKVRKYVNYTWGQSSINIKSRSKSSQIIRGSRSLHKMNQASRILYLQNVSGMPSEKQANNIKIESKREA